MYIITYIHICFLSLSLIVYVIFPSLILYVTFLFPFGQLAEFWDGPRSGSI